MNRLVLICAVLCVLAAGAAYVDGHAGWLGYVGAVSSLVFRVFLAAMLGIAALKSNSNCRICGRHEDDRP